jgi:arylsulfatase
VLALLHVAAFCGLVAAGCDEPTADGTKRLPAVAAAPGPAGKTVSPVAPAGCEGCNIVLVLIDTLRADHLGTYGYARETSPNIDALARRAVVFRNVIAQSTWTKPGTASLMTGLFPKNHGANTQADRLSDDHLLLSQYLRRGGYRTHAFLANGNAGASFNFDRGYDTYDFFPEDPERIGAQTRSDRMNERILPFVRQLDRDDKFFLYVHYVDPHVPYDPGERFFSKSNTIEFDKTFFNEMQFKRLLGSPEERADLLRQAVDEYDDEVRFNDASFGALLSALEGRGFLEDTVVVVVSDHGEELLERDSFGHTNAPYEDQVRVPLIVYVPGVGHREVVEPVGQVDLVPSLLSLVGLERPTGIDGVDVFRAPWSREASYAEIESKHRTCATVWLAGEKLTKCENTMAPGKERDGGTSRWFENVAHFPFDGGALDLEIQSFYEPRQLAIRADGILVREAAIGTRRERLQVDLGEPRRREIEIRSTKPCRRPIDVGVDNSRKCLSFRLFSSSNVNLEDMSVPTNRYVQLAEDPGENHNLYYLPEKAGRVEALESALTHYLAARRREPGSSEKVELTEAQKETLRALGYAP